MIRGITKSGKILKINKIKQNNTCDKNKKHLFALSFKQKNYV